MSLLRFQATALTPIHVGTGETISPEDYLVQGDELVRFNSHAVLRDMAASDRRTYEKRLQGNDFQSAQNLLRQCCKPDKHGMYRAEIGPGSKRELKNLLENPDRRGHVYPLLRNLHTGEPVVPGSSIKGAIRTAIVNAFSQQHLDTVRSAVDREPDKDQRWKPLESAALGYERHNTESDPLRMLKVADAALPVDSVRVDQATIIKDQPGRRDNRQMHYERLLSRADGGQPPGFSVEMELDERQAHHARVKDLLGRQLDWQHLRAACNSFYVNRMAAELARFFSQEPQPEARYGAEKLVKWKGQKLLIAKSIQERGLLLRLGRFSHFESLSIDTLRKGWHVQKRRPIDGMGSTRTLCETRGGLQTPFGWLLLRLENT